MCDSGEIGQGELPRIHQSYEALRENAPHLLVLHLSLPQGWKKSHQFVFVNHNLLVLLRGCLVFLLQPRDDHGLESIPESIASELALMHSSHKVDSNSPSIGLVFEFT